MDHCHAEALTGAGRNLDQHLAQAVVAAHRWADVDGWPRQQSVVDQAELNQELDQSGSEAEFQPLGHSAEYLRWGGGSDEQRANVVDRDLDQT